MLAACPAEGRATIFVEATEGRLLYGWVCGGWAGSKNSKTLSAAKERGWMSASVRGAGARSSGVGAKIAVE